MTKSKCLSKKIYRNVFNKIIDQIFLRKNISIVCNLKNLSHILIQQIERILFMKKFSNFLDKRINRNLFYEKN